MASQTDPLMILANAALRFDWEQGQQSALSPISPPSPISSFSASPSSSPEVATTEPEALAEKSTNSVSREGEATGSHSSRGRKQQRRSTQGANSASATNNSSPIQQQQPAPSQSFTAVNRTQRNGGFTPINPHPQPRKTAAPRAPSRKHKAPTQNSKAQKPKPSTKGSNRRTGRGELTAACGVITPSIKTPVAKDNNKGDFRCPRCKGRFTRPKSVKDHFAGCVRKHGNPRGLKWFDHRTCDKSRNHYNNKMTTIREVDEVEEEEGEGEDDRDEEQDYDDEDDLEDYGEDDEPDQEQDSSNGEHLQVYGDGYRTDPDQEQDHGQEDDDEYGDDEYMYDDESMDEEEEDSSQGEEDHSRDTSVVAASTPVYPRIEEPALIEGRSGTCPTPGYGPDGYRTPVQTNYRRDWTPSPSPDGRSYTPGVGVGYETPLQSNGHDDDGDSIMDG